MRKQTKPAPATCDERDVTYVRTCIEEARGIIERGDQRLLAGDGPAGGQPPELSLDEWRQMYVLLTNASKRLWKRAKMLKPEVPRD